VDSSECLGEIVGGRRRWVCRTGAVSALVIDRIGGRSSVFLSGPLLVGPCRCVGVRRGRVSRVSAGGSSGRARVPGSRSDFGEAGGDSARWPARGPLAGVGDTLPPLVAAESLVSTIRYIRCCMGDGLGCRLNSACVAAVVGSPAACGVSPGRDRGPVAPRGRERGEEPCCGRRGKLAAGGSGLGWIAVPECCCTGVAGRSPVRAGLPAWWAWARCSRMRFTGPGWCRFLIRRICRCRGNA